MTPPLSHAEMQTKMCGVCFRSKSDKMRQKITPSLLQDIRDHQYPEYSLYNNGLPLSICKSCVQGLKRHKAVIIFYLRYFLKKYKLILFVTI